MKIAFYGLGNMGGPMARNLVKAGFEVTVYDLVVTAVDELVAAGAKAAKTPGEAALSADVVVTMLPNGKIAKELYIGPNGILKNAMAGALLIDCSTISYLDSQEIHRHAKSSGFEFIDAPVSGGTAGAQSGTLTFIVGGENTSFEKARPVLSKMGANIFHAGDVGAGQIAKMANNMLLAIHMIGTSEALALGTKLGLDPKVLSEIMKKSSGDNWSLQKYNPCPGVMENVPASREYQGGFMVDLMSKDLSLAAEASVVSKSITPMGDLALSLYKMHAKNGHGKLDFSSIINAFKE